MESLGEQPLVETLFELRPQTCVIPSFSVQCELNITFIWRTVTPQPICLFRKNENIALYCEEKSNGQQSLTLKLALPDSTTFMLKNASTKKTIAIKQLTIMKVSTKELRRRRKPAWSFL